MHMAVHSLISVMKAYIVHSECLDPSEKRLDWAINYRPSVGLMTGHLVKAGDMSAKANPLLRFDNRILLSPQMSHGSRSIASELMIRNGRTRTSGELFPFFLPSSFWIIASVPRHDSEDEDLCLHLQYAYIYIYKGINDRGALIMEYEEKCLNLSVAYIAGFVGVYWMNCQITTFGVDCSRS